MGKINVCLSSDNNYAKHLGVVIASILYNAKEEDELSFYILDGGIEDNLRKDIMSLKSLKDCDIKFIKINDEMFSEYKQVRTHYYITLPSFYRLKLAQILPEVDRIIYFDCDFVVCTSLKELFEKDIGNNIIAGVHDTNKRRVKKNPTYINAGMIVFDLKKMREQNIEKEFFNWTITNIDKIKLGDQEIINEVLKGKIEILEDEWNVQSSNFSNRSSYTNNPKAVHMLGKPWVYASLCVHKYLYFKYLQMTPWSLTEEEYRHWTEDNERDSCIKYFKRRPFFWLRGCYYKALWEQYFNPNNRKIVRTKIHGFAEGESEFFTKRNNEALRGD